MILEHTYIEPGGHIDKHMILEHTYIVPGGHIQHLDVSHTVQRDTGIVRVIKPTICTYKT